MDNTKKNFIWNMVGSTINAFTSLIFMIIVTRINGTDTAGIFTFAFSLACLFQVISNYSGRTFQVTNNDKNISDSDFVYNKISTCFIMLICVIIYLFAKSYSSFKNIVIILFIIYRIIESYVDVYYGIIQKNDSLYKVGISLTIKSLVCIIIFFIIDYFTKDIIFSIISLLIVNICVFIFYDKKNYKEYYKKQILLKLGIFICGFNFLTQYILNAPKYAIDDILNNQSQTIYGIISMPATMLILCSQFIIQPLLSIITKHIKNNEYLLLRKLTFKIILYVILIGIIGEIGCYFVGIPFLELIYGISLEKYLLHLMIIIFGATNFGIVFVISSVLIALRKNFVQMVFYVIASISVTIIANTFVSNYNLLGACILYSTIMILLCAMYLGYFIYTIKKLEKNNKMIEG